MKYIESTMSKYSSLPMRYPSMSFFTEQIDNYETFSYVRLQHGIWDRIRIAHIDGLSPARIGGRMSKMQPTLLHQPNPWHLDPKVMTSAIQYIREDKPDNFYYAPSDIACYFGDEIPTPKQRKLDGHEIIEKYLPKHTMYYSPLCWKKWSITGEIHRFFMKYKDLMLVNIGPIHLSNFGYKLNLSNHDIIPLHYTEASSHVDATIDRIQEKHSEYLKKSDRVIYLMSAGILCVYFSSKLHDKLKNAFFIDVGRAIDIYYYYDQVKINAPKWMWGKWMEYRPPTWLQSRVKII